MTYTSDIHVNHDHDTVSLWDTPFKYTLVSLDLYSALSFNNESIILFIWELVGDMKRCGGVHCGQPALLHFAQPDACMQQENKRYKEYYNDRNYVMCQYQRVMERFAMCNIAKTNRYFSDPK